MPESRPINYEGEDDHGVWARERAICQHCGHEWIAVHPCCEELECPQCHEYGPSQHANWMNEWIERQLKEPNQGSEP